LVNRRDRAFGAVAPPCEGGEYAAHFGITLAMDGSYSEKQTQWSEDLKSLTIL
jgi:hypothetical protein